MIQNTPFLFLAYSIFVSISYVNGFWFTVEIRKIDWNSKCAENLECVQPRLRLQLDLTQTGQQQTASWPMKQDKIKDTISTFISHWSEASVADLAISAQLTGWNDVGQKACDRTPRILPIDAEGVSNDRAAKTIDLQAKCFNITLQVRSFEEKDGSVNSQFDKNLAISNWLKSIESFLGGTEVIFWSAMAALILCILSLVGLAIALIVLKKEKKTKNSARFNPYYIQLPVDKQPISGYDIPYTRNLRDFHDERMETKRNSEFIFPNSQLTPLTSSSTIGDTTALIPSSRPPPIPFHLHPTPSSIDSVVSAGAEMLQRQDREMSDLERRQLGKSYIIEEDVLVERFETEIV